MVLTLFHFAFGCLLSSIYRVRLCKAVIGIEWLSAYEHVFKMLIAFLLQVLVDQLAMQQDNSEKEVRGPPASKAFDADGNCTKV